MESKNKTTALIITAIGTFLTSFMVSSVNIAMPSIGRDYNMSAVFLSWVATSYLLASAALLLPFGKLGDIHGRKKVFASGTILFTISSFMCIVSPSSFWLILSRVLQGAGSAMIFSTAVAIITSVFPPHERGKAIGINTGAVYIGLSMGPVLGGFLVGEFGWRSIFIATIVCGTFVAVLIFLKLKGEWAEARGERFDLTGTLIYCASLITLMYGLSGLPDPGGAVFILAGVGGIALFIYWELKAGNPVLKVELFRKNRVFTLSSLSALINYSASFAVVFLMSLYLQYTKRLPPNSAGLILVSQPVVMAVVAPLAGRLSDRIEPRIVASVGMGFTTFALLMLAGLGENTNLIIVVINLMIMGFGLALFSSPNTNAIMSSVEKKFYGIGSAMVGTMRLLGQMLSMGIATLLFSIYIGEVQITPEYYPMFLASAKMAFTVFAVLCFLGIFSSMARGRVRG